MRGKMDMRMGKASSQIEGGGGAAATTTVELSTNGSDWTALANGGEYVTGNMNGKELSVRVTRTGSTVTIDKAFTLNWPVLAPKAGDAYSLHVDAVNPPTPLDVEEGTPVTVIWEPGQDGTCGPARIILVIDGVDFVINLLSYRMSGSVLTVNAAGTAVSAPVRNGVTLPDAAAGYTTLAAAIAAADATDCDMVIFTEGGEWSIGDVGVGTKNIAIGRTDAVGFTEDDSNAGRYGTGCRITGRVHWAGGVGKTFLIDGLGCYQDASATQFLAWEHTDGSAVARRCQFKKRQLYDSVVMYGSGGGTAQGLIDGCSIEFGNDSNGAANSSPNDGALRITGVTAAGYEVGSKSAVYSGGVGSSARVGGVAGLAVNSGTFGALVFSAQTEAFVDGTSGGSPGQGYNGSPDGSAPGAIDRDLSTPTDLIEDDGASYDMRTTEEKLIAFPVLTMLLLQRVVGLDLYGNYRCMPSGKRPAFYLGAHQPALSADPNWLARVTNAAGTGNISLAGGVQMSLESGDVVKVAGSDERMIVVGSNSVYGAIARAWDGTAAESISLGDDIELVHRRGDLVPTGDAVSAINNGAGYDDNDTSLVVDNGAGFYIGMLIQSDQGTPNTEIMRVTNVVGNTITVQRGFGGTPAEALADNQLLFEMRPPGY